MELRDRKWVAEDGAGPVGTGQGGGPPKGLSSDLFEVTADRTCGWLGPRLQEVLLDRIPSDKGVTIFQSRAGRDDTGCAVEFEFHTKE